MTVTMEQRKKLARIKSRAQTRDKDKSAFNIYVKLFTEEKFPLKNVSNDMKIRELKQYMEFATGIPVHMQRISYLDDGELLDHTDIRSNDIVPGATLQMRVWPMWRELIEACASNDLEWVLRLGVTQPTDYHTPGSDYMTKRARKIWLQERAFLALYVAAHRGHENLVRSLIDAGADVNACTPLGRSPLHVAAAMGHGHIVDLLLEKGADIDAEDEHGETALTIAAKFGHKTCERHLFLFRWQERAKRTKPSEEPAMKAHQYFDSAFPVWKKGKQVQLYFANILPPGEYEGTRFNSPKKQIPADAEEQDYEDIEIVRIGKDGKLPAILEEKGRRVKSGPARISKRTGFTYNDWLGRKKSAEQKIINVRKAEEEKKRLEEEERRTETAFSEDLRKRQEAEKSESYETWLAAKETEKKTPQAIRPIPEITVERVSEPKAEGYLRTYLKSLDERRKGSAYFCYEDWLNQKEEQILGLKRTKTTIIS